MTFDGTNVDLDELQSFSSAADDWSTRTASAARTVEDVHLGPDMLGLFVRPFLNSVTADRADVAAKLRAVSTALAEDGTTASAVARDFDNTNTAQADLFTDKELS